MTEQLWPTDLHRRSTQVGSLAVVAILTSAVLTIIFGLSNTKVLIHGFDVVYRPPFIPAANPILADLEGIGPIATAKKPQPDNAIQALEVVNGGVYHYEGGVAVSGANLAPGPVSLSELTTAVNDPTLIARSGTTYTLKVGLFCGLQANCDFTGNGSTTIVLANRPGVLLGATNSGTLTLSGLTVTSTSTNPGTPQHPVFRPSVYVDERARLFAYHDTFENLGWDWAGSYGLSLQQKAVGTISDCTSVHNFIGLYTEQIHKLTVENSTFDDNRLYGIDPHTDSSNLTFIHDIAEHNDAVGMIFANNVSSSTLEDSTSAYNGEDGIEMYGGSSGNLIAGNTSMHNTGDGVVLNGSNDNTVVSNTIEHNRVGVMITDPNAATPTVEHNVIRHNLEVSRGITLDASNADIDNVGVSLSPPPSWHWLINYIAWPISIGLALYALVARIRERSKFSQYRLPGAAQRASESS